MASYAAFDLRRRMFKDIWAAFLHVALYARLRAVSHQFGSIGRPVAVVAIRAFQCSFRNAVMRRKSELRADIRVTLIAQLRLRFLKEAAVQPAILLAQFRYREEV